MATISFEREMIARKEDAEILENAKPTQLLLDLLSHSKPQSIQDNSKSEVVQYWVTKIASQQK